MGCCVSKGGADGTYAVSNKSRRELAWRRTGIVGLRDAHLKDIPSVLFSDAGLCNVVKTLDVSNNRVTVLPEAIGVLTNMKTLSLSRNALRGLPFGLSRCVHLKTLVLDGNFLEKLPADVNFYAPLAKLTTLSLRRNSLADLPDAIGRLTALTHLNVSGNNLKGLPSTIGQCVKLETIDASENQSSTGEFTVPKQLGGCAALASLVLDGSAVQTIPSAILTGCTRLVTLSLHACPVVMRELEETPGWFEYEQRVKGKHGKKITGNVLIDGARGLDDGVDRREARIVPHSGRV